MQGPVVVNPVEAVSERVAFPSWREIAGLGAALAPFALSVSFTYVRHLDTGLARAATLDLAALAGGTFACAFAVLGLAAIARTADRHRIARGALIVGIAALGALQLHRASDVADRDLTGDHRGEPGLGVHVSSEVPGLDALAQRIDEAFRPAWPAVARDTIRAWRDGDIATLAALTGATDARATARLAEHHARSVAQLGRLEHCGPLEELALLDGGIRRFGTTCRFERGTAVFVFAASPTGLHEGFSAYAAHASPFSLSEMR